MKTLTQPGPTDSPSLKILRAPGQEPGAWHPVLHPERSVPLGSGTGGLGLSPPARPEGLWEGLGAVLRKSTSFDPRPPSHSGHRSNGKATAITGGSGPFASSSRERASHFLEVSTEPTGRGTPQQHLLHPHTPKSPRLGRSGPSSSRSRKTETDGLLSFPGLTYPSQPLGQAGVGGGGTGRKRRRTWASEACQPCCSPPHKGPGHPCISSGVRHCLLQSQPTGRVHPSLGDFSHIWPSWEPTAS